ncbi:acetyltransferase [Histoplasma ohiense]|nr:acetyltransferase [Histoplasma ohiense (nom. inval.)]
MKPSLRIMYVCMYSLFATRGSYDLAWMRNGCLAHKLMCMAKRQQGAGEWRLLRRADKKRGLF